jgi:hypothetical protein
MVMIGFLVFLKPFLEAKECRDEELVKLKARIPVVQARHFVCLMAPTLGAFIPLKETTTVY